MFSPIIQKAIDWFSKFPTIGQRTAKRFVFYLIKLPEQEFNEFIKTIISLKKSIKICSFCSNPFDSSITHEQEKFCPICRDNSREKTLLCIVEKENDLISIENTEKYKGIYFILNNAISGLKNQNIKELRIKELEQKIKNPESFGLHNTHFKEIIIAVNPTVEGEAIRLYLERKLKSILPENIKITHLGRGLPVGGELEYADEETLINALEGRK